MQLPSGSWPVRRLPWSAVLLILSIGPIARADGLFIDACCSARDVAFARYTTSQVQHDPFPKSGSVAILIEASLPEFYRSAALVAVREQGANDRELHVLDISGDESVAAEVIDRYFTLRQSVDALPLSSVAITPVNYRFRFAGEVKTGGAVAFIYEIKPKKNRPGLVAGRLWIDSVTGREVLLAGHLLNMPARGGSVEVVRNTKLINGAACARVTHVTFGIPRLGRAAVVITEIVLSPEIRQLPE
jgi:hypothetical protein